MSYLEARKAQNPRLPTDGELDPKLLGGGQLKLGCSGGRKKEMRD